MGIKRKIIFFVALMSLFYCLTLMQDTYAKYISSADATAGLTIARWNILLNDQDILVNSNFSDTIVPTFEGTDNIKSDVIAPTAEGYFEIELDGTDTDVSFDYTISITKPNTNTVDDLIITGYEIDGTSYTYDDEDDITGEILFDDLDKVKNFTFYVEWDDNESTQTMNNAQDTATTNGGEASFYITVNVVQKR